MASTVQALRNFNDMLNEYLPNKLMQNEMLKRDYILNKVEKDDGWKGNNNVVVPFVGAGASSVSFGSLTASNDIAEDTTVRGTVSSAKEIWGSMMQKYGPQVGKSMRDAAEKEIAAASK